MDASAASQRVPMTTIPIVVRPVFRDAGGPRVRPDALGRTPKSPAQNAGTRWDALPPATGTFSASLKGTQNDQPRPNHTSSRSTSGARPVPATTTLGATRLAAGKWAIGKFRLSRTHPGSHRHAWTIRLNGRRVGTARTLGEARERIAGLES